MPSRILREGILTSERVAIARSRNTRYNVRVSAKKALIGFSRPSQFAAKSRTRTVCGFFHSTSYGGADGMAQAMPVFAPRVARSTNPSALPPDLVVCRQSSTATLGADHG